LLEGAHIVVVVVGGGDVVLVLGVGEGMWW
jgi:hypothetical protein